MRSLAGEASGGASYWRTLRQLREELSKQRPVREEAVTLRATDREYHFALALPLEDDRVLDDWVQALATATTAAPGGLDEERLAALYLPYWATPWPSGFALGELALSERPALAGKRSLELGCGLGVTAVAALVAGATLTAADCFPEALAFCRYNALRNTGMEPALVLADWRTADGRSRLGEGGRYEIVLAADVLYDEEDVAPLLTLIPALLAPRGELWLADPGRDAASRFAAEASRLGWSGDETAVEGEWPAGAGRGRITLHRYRRFT
jgi:predicted nicotinamide N-methyase